MARTTNTPCARPGCHNFATIPPSHRGLCYKHAEAAGLIDHPVPADRARHHLRTVMDQGASVTGIHAATGVPLASIWGVVRGRYHHVRQSTEKAMLTATPDMSVTIPATGSIRRLRALRAQGWNAKTDLPQALGVSFQTITNLTNNPSPNRRIRVDFAMKIREFSDAHPEVVGPPSSWVRDRQWPVSYDWENIDDPDEEHWRTNWSEKVPSEHPVARALEDIPPAEVAARMGMTRTAVHKLRSRARAGRLSVQQAGEVGAALGIAA